MEPNRERLTLFDEINPVNKFHTNAGQKLNGSFCGTTIRKQLFMAMAKYLPNRLIHVLRNLSKNQLKTTSETFARYLLVRVCAEVFKPGNFYKQRTIFPDLNHNFPFQY